MTTLWNYLKGYVIIEVSGFSIERFFNLTLHNGINIRDLKETKNGVTCKVSISNFKKLKSFSKKTKCKVKIKQKIGLPFILFKNRKRKAFFIGVLFFISFILYLSSFIWSIEVIGNKNIDNNTILKFCEENGFYVGSYKRNIKIKELETLLKNNFEELSWITIQINGTKSVIKLAENLPKTDIVKENPSPSNIVAKTDGIITEIVTRNGTPLVKEKDIVKAGDVLVSSVLEIKEGEVVKGVKFVKADADIRAKSWHKITVALPLEYTEKQYTGKTRVGFEFLAFNKTFDLNFIKDNTFDGNYDKISKRTQLKLGENFVLPFMLISYKYKEYSLIKKTYTLNTAKEVVNRIINQKIISGFDFSIDILEKDISFEEYEDKIVATANLTIIQNIGVNKEVTEDEQLERSLKFGEKESTDTQ